MMSEIDMRGESDPKGSWNTICMSRRNGRICLNFKPWISLPRKTIGPFEEISRRMARPSVVLPEPDSPTTPSVSPLRISTLTPSTALMWPTTLRNTPRLIGNQTLRSVVSTTTGASGCNGAGFGFGSAQRRSRVYGCSAAVNTRSTLPCSTILPRFITHTRSATLRTIPRSCVMNSSDMPRRD